MSHTTWKTTTPTWRTKLVDFFTCSKKKGMVVARDPELNKGIGSGLTAHEAVEQYQYQKRMTMDAASVGHLSIRSMKKRAPNQLQEIANSKSHRTLNEVETKSETGSRKKRANTTDSEADDMNFIFSAFQDKDDASEDGAEKKIEQVLKDDISLASKETEESFAEDAETLYKEQQLEKKMGKSIKAPPPPKMQLVEQQIVSNPIPIKTVSSHTGKVKKDTVRESLKSEGGASMRSSFDVPEVEEQIDWLVKSPPPKVITRLPLPSSLSDAESDSDAEFHEFIDQVKNDQGFTTLNAPAGLIKGNTLTRRKPN